MDIDFKGSHYPKDVILYAVFFYVRYAVSCRDLEEIMPERSVQIDHATLNRWVIKYTLEIAKTVQSGPFWITLINTLLQTARLCLRFHLAKTSTHRSPITAS